MTALIDRVWKRHRRADALALADDWVQGTTLHADSRGANAIMLVLATEVRRLREEVEPLKSDFDTYMRIANEEANRAASLEADAARYRFLAARCRSTAEHWGGRWSIVIDGPAPRRHDDEDDFDAAIDAAMEASNAG